MWVEDTKKAYDIHFFVQGSEYKLLGFIPMNLHLFGVEEGGAIHILGTDKFGRDLWGKACEAGRISLTMSLFGTIISIIIGSVLGVASGYYGGWIDNVFAAVYRVCYRFPSTAAVDGAGGSHSQNGGFFQCFRGDGLHLRAAVMDDTGA